MEESIADKEIDTVENVQHTVEDKRRRKKVATRDQPRNYFRLTNMLVTFAGWLYVQFGGKCNLYLDVLGLY